MTGYKKDFNKQRMIDRYNELKDQGSVQGDEKRCGMCSKRSLEFSHYCHECAYFICQGCHRIHLNNQPLQVHNLQAIGDILKQRDEQIKNTISELKKEVMNIDFKLDEASKNIKKVKASKETQITELKKLANKVKKDVTENEKRLEKQIINANDDVVKFLGDNEETLYKHRSEFTSKISCLENLKKNQDLAALHDTLKPVPVASMTGIDVEKMKKSISDLTTNVQSPVSIKIVKMPDIKGSIELSICQMKPTSQSLLSVLQKTYSALRKNTLEVTDWKPITHQAMKLTIVHDQLWSVSYEGDLNIYDKKCQDV